MIDNVIKKTEVKDTIETIEKDLKKNSKLLLNNFNTFQQKYRGNENLDIILYTEYNEIAKKTYIKLYVADLSDRVFITYRVEEGELKKLNTSRKDGHKRIHYKLR